MGYRSKPYPFARTKEQTKFAAYQEGGISRVCGEVIYVDDASWVLDCGIHVFFKDNPAKDYTPKLEAADSCPLRVHETERGAFQARAQTYGRVTETWVDTDGQHILTNTAQGRQKVRNVRRDPRVAVQIIDPATDYRIFSVRGRVVEVTRDGADAMIASRKKYLDQDPYPLRRPAEVRDILMLPEKIVMAMGVD